MRAPMSVAGRVLIHGHLSESTPPPLPHRACPTVTLMRTTPLCRRHRWQLISPPLLLFPLHHPTLGPPLIPTLAAAPELFWDGAASVTGGARHALINQAAVVTD